MKKIPFLMLAFMLLAISTSLTAYASSQNQIHIVVNGKEIHSDQPPVIRDDRVFVPVRVIAESLGAAVDFRDGQSYDKRVYISDGKHTSEFNFNNAFCLIDGLELAMDTIPFIENGRTLLPVRIVSQALGCLVSWDGDTETVYIVQSEYDESEYDDLKLYPDKPLVYDAYSDEVLRYLSPTYTYYNTYCIPAINIDTPEAKSVSDEMYKLGQDMLSDNEEDVIWFGIQYTYSIHDGILSVVIYAIGDCWDKYHVFNYDIESAKVLSTEELLSRYNISPDQLKNAVKNSCSAHKKANKQSAAIFDPDDRWGIEYSVFELSTPLFIDNSGNIRIILDSYLDDDGEFTIDSGINPVNITK